MALCHYEWVATGFAYQTDTNDYEVVKFSSFCAFEADIEAVVYTLLEKVWNLIETQQYRVLFCYVYIYHIC